MFKPGFSPEDMRKKEDSDFIAAAISALSEVGLHQAPPVTQAALAQDTYRALQFDYPVRCCPLS